MQGSSGKTQRSCFLMVWQPRDRGGGVNTSKPLRKKKKFIKGKIGKKKTKNI